MNWQEISVLTEEIIVEALAGIFRNMGSGGVVIEDIHSARKIIDPQTALGKALAKDGLSDNMVVVKAYFLEDQEVMPEVIQSVEEVNENFGVSSKIFVEAVRNEDWEETWKEHYHTFKVSDRIVIKPSWEEYQPSKQEIIIDLDPGMAFGTGIHASTRFCLKFIDQYIKGGENIIDAGCGSGILSIAAAKLGATKILAMDIDELAVRVAKENISINGLDDKICVEAGNIIATIHEYQADIVFANILAEVILELLPEAVKALVPGGYFFGSGIVNTSWPMVKDALEAHGLEVEQVLQETDWVGVAARKI